MISLASCRSSASIEELSTGADASSRVWARRLLARSYSRPDQPRNYSGLRPGEFISAIITPGWIVVLSLLASVCSDSVESRFKLVGAGDFNASENVSQIIDQGRLRAAEKLNDLPRATVALTIDTMNYTGKRTAVVQLGNELAQRPLPSAGPYPMCYRKTGLRFDLSQSAHLRRTYIFSAPAGYEWIKLSTGDTPLMFLEYDINANDHVYLGYFGYSGEGNKASVSIEQWPTPRAAANVKSATFHRSSATDQISPVKIDDVCIY